MKTYIHKYFAEFWSPEKILLLSLAFISFIVRELHTFYFLICRSGNKYPEVVNCLSDGMIEGLLAPVARSSSELTIFFLLLLLLPLTLFRPWLKYIASWSIPFGILLYLGGGDGTGGIPAAGFTSAAMLEAAVRGWILLLVGFIVFNICRWAWRRHSA